MSNATATSSSNLSCPEFQTREMPTILHFTHYKAGSQWIKAILRACVPDRIVEPRADFSQFLAEPVKTGWIYPTLYISREEYMKTPVPEPHRLFFVMRDLRDTLVSYYFSLKHSHPAINDHITTMRDRLNAVSAEEGLLMLIERYLDGMRDVQLSWIDAGVPVLRYEDLLSNDVALLEEVLIGHCGLPVTSDRLAKIVRSQRFEQRTGGRSRGQEDRQSHQRKGIAGDWRNTFTPAVTDAFKARHGHVLVKTGYETDLNW